MFLASEDEPDRYDDQGAGHPCEGYFEFVMTSEVLREVDVELEDHRWKELICWSCGDVREGDKEAVICWDCMHGEEEEEAEMSGKDS